jgi:polyisoprenoid-binding protein YceI
MATETSDARLTGKWSFDPIHSSASFTVDYLVAPFRAGFGRFRAELADGRLSGVVEVASIDVKDENFATHLQAPNFFDAERFPEITFRSEPLQTNGDELVVEGDLTLKGVTRRVRATGSIKGPAEDFMGNTRLGVALSTTIDRTDFDLSWNAPLPKGGLALADEVTLSVELEFVAA